MEVIVQVAQLVLALSILVGIHEAGHMIAARMFGMRVEKFFIGFPPTIFSFKKGDTEYGLGGIPLGGFVKISGMIDESMDKEQMKQEPQPWEFRSKPAWQRLIVMLGGIFVNVLAGIIAMIILTYNLGDQYLPSVHPKTDGIIAGKYAEQMGLQTGDKILDINGEDYRAFRDLSAVSLFVTDGNYYTVERNGQTLQVNIPDELTRIMTKDIQDFSNNFIDPRIPFTVSYEEVEETGARAFGLEEGDQIVSLGDYKIDYFDQLRPALENYVGSEVPMVVSRNGNQVELNAIVRQDTSLGFRPVSTLVRQKDDYTFGQAVTKGTEEAFSFVIDNAKAMGQMFTGKVPARSMSGPIGIYKIFPKTWSWNAFWRVTAFISMILAFMNLLPIPALDGGHVMFLLYEMISGKAPSDQFLENAQKVGMFILLGLMVFVFGNDILKLFGI